MKNIKIEFTNERIIPASGLAVVGAILGKSDFVKHCNRIGLLKRFKIVVSSALITIRMTSTTMFYIMDNCS